MADIHNVLPAGLVAIVVFLVFADLLAAQTFHCAVCGAVTEIPAVVLTHITLRLSQHTLAAE
jgi:type IV secretory pathway TrbL component